MTEVIHEASGIRSIVPGDYDADFILAEAGNPNHAGWMHNEDGTRLIAYHPNDHAAVIAVIDDYPALYLAKKAKPDARRQIGEIGRQKARAFTFNGVSLDLDQGTEARIGGAVTYLTRNEGVAELHWDLTGDGDFITLPREAVLAMGDAAGAHVQACFAHRKALTDAVNAAADLEALAAIDLQAGWPA